MKKITLFALVALLLTACAPKSYTEFENDLNAFREEVGNVGLGVAVVKENKLIYDNYFGVKNLETGEKIDAQTISGLPPSPNLLPQQPLCSWLNKGR